MGKKLAIMSWIREKLCTTRRSPFLRQTRSLRVDSRHHRSPRLYPPKYTTRSACWDIQVLYVSFDIRSILLDGQTNAIGAMVRVFEGAKRL